MIAYVYLYMGKFNFTENIYIYVYLYLSYVYIDMGIYFNVMGQMDDSASVQDGMWQSADGKDEAQPRSRAMVDLPGLDGWNVVQTFKPQDLWG